MWEISLRNDALCTYSPLSVSRAHYVSRNYFVASDLAFFGHRPDVAAAGYLGPCECRHVRAAEETTECVFLFNMERGPVRLVVGGVRMD